MHSTHRPSRCQEKWWGKYKWGTCKSGKGKQCKQGKGPS